MQNSILYKWNNIYTLIDLICEFHYHRSFVCKQRPKYTSFKDTKKEYARSSDQREKACSAFFAAHSTEYPHRNPSHRYSVFQTTKKVLVASTMCCSLPPFHLVFSEDHTSSEASIQGSPVEHDGIFDIIPGVRHNGDAGVLTSGNLPNTPAHTSAHASVHTSDSLLPP